MTLKSQFSPDLVFSSYLVGSCVKCGKGVFGAGQACQAMGDLYHDACFTCAACSKCAAVGVGRGEAVGMEPRPFCVPGGRVTLHLERILRARILNPWHEANEARRLTSKHLRW